AVKSNIGHTQAAAGVAGVIKMVLAMRHGLLPKTLWAKEPSPHVDWDAGEIILLSDPVEWQPSKRPRRAGVSSFGISGTNAHVILEEAPVESESVSEPEGSERVVELGRRLPFVVSASSERALTAQAAKLKEFVQERPGLDLVGVSAASAVARAPLPHRAVAFA